MGDRELKRWASDQLHELLGFSQGYLADYVLSLARKERTVAGLVKALGEADVPGGERTQRFARELIERTPRARADASEGFFAHDAATVSNAVRLSTRAPSAASSARGAPPRVRASQSQS